MDLKEICLPVQKEITSLERVMADHLRSEVPFVQSVADYVVQNGGKRLRPILTILGARLSGYQGDASVALGAAIEFMHTATLLHDDVIDNAGLRRGRLSTNAKWGNHVSVLVGDFFYCRAMDILVKHKDFKVLKVITDAITSTTEGEIFEITKSNDLTTTEDDYIKIIIGKTAILIGAACQTGAILGNVSEEFEFALKKFGMNIGIAFQLMDDVLDYVSSEKEFGKTNGIDLKEGKLTLPLLVALKKCSDEEGQIIKKTLMVDELDPELFKKVLEIVQRYDGLRHTQLLAKKYVQEAQAALSPFKPSLEKDALMAIADYVIVRKS